MTSPRSTTSLSSPALAAMHERMAIPSGVLISAVLAGVATLGSAFALAAVSGYLITKAWTMPPVLDLTVAVVSVRALGISRGIFRYLERLRTHSGALQGVANLRTSLYATLAGSPRTSIASLRRGELLGRLGDDAEDMANDIIRAYVPALVAAFMAVVVLGTITPFSPAAAACMLLGLFIACVIAPRFAFASALVTERDLVQARGELSTLTLHTMDNAHLLRVRGEWEGALAQLREAQHSYDRAMDRAATPSAWARAGIHLAMIPSLLGSVLAAGAVYNGTHAGLLSGVMGHGAGLVGVLLLLPLSSFEAASVLPMAATQRARSLVAAERLARVIEPPAAVPCETPDTAAHVAGEGGASITRSAPPMARPASAPALEVHELVTGWSPHAPLTTPLTLTAKPGSRIVIRGSSGRGKTTLALTLAGTIPPVSGSVTPLSPDTVTLYAEDAHVFHTSLRENIRVVDNALTDSAIHDALTSAGLGAWLASLPHGLDTVLGAGAEDISGGERRRLLLARALARKAPVTILDEPTEHLDMEHTATLMRGILTPGDFFPDTSTVIVITHDTRFSNAGTHMIDLDRLAPTKDPA